MPSVSGPAPVALTRVSTFEAEPAVEEVSVARTEPPRRQTRTPPRPVGPTWVGWARPTSSGATPTRRLFGRSLSTKERPLFVTSPLPVVTIVTVVVEAVLAGCCRKPVVQVARR